VKRILVTGGAGFIASHFVEHLLRNTNWEIVILDKLTYASNGFNRLREVGAYENPRVRLYPVDLVRRIGSELEREIGSISYIVHMAAETHVDNSIKDPRSFVEANVLATTEILEYARRIPTLEKLLYFSTDEVFGPAPSGIRYKEWDRYNSTNPYSATKAAGEELCLAWANTYKTPTMITHTMNAFGERQHPEKFIPKVVKAVLKGENVTVHGSPEGVSGSRFYIHCRNIAAATLFLLEHGEVRDKYNIVGEQEVSNLELAQAIADILGKPLYHEIVDFHTSRPGHDLRYALDGTKLHEMGWEIPKKFGESLEKTINWMIRPENESWLNLKGEKS
jgi:dTDP-glucose 4,6-dehydratase